MKTITKKRLERLQRNGYTNIFIGNQYVLVKKYSKNNRSLWKRYCPFYSIFRITFTEEQ